MTPCLSDYWMSDIGLFVKDKLILQTTEWINDNIINAAQMMLKKRFGSEIAGWQSPQCNKKVSLFKVILDNVPFIQILNVSQCHWIVVSNMPFKKNNDSIYIYDSLLMTKVSGSLVNTVCIFFKCHYTDRLHFDVINVQRQTDDHNCGVLAIAFATELAFGQDPASSVWNTSVMRSHLFQAFQQNSLERFPRIGQRSLRLGRRVHKSHPVTIHCVCRMPNDPQKGMVECFCCLKWFHISCCIKDEEWNSQRKWRCKKCSNLIASLE